MPRRHAGRAPLPRPALGSGVSAGGRGRGCEDGSTSARRCERDDDAPGLRPRHRRGTPPRFGSRSASRRIRASASTYPEFSYAKPTLVPGTWSAYRIRVSRSSPWRPGANSVKGLPRPRLTTLMPLTPRRRPSSPCTRGDGELRQPTGFNAGGLGPDRRNNCDPCGRSSRPFS